MAFNPLQNLQTLQPVYIGTIGTSHVYDFNVAPAPLTLNFSAPAPLPALVSLTFNCTPLTLAGGLQTRLPAHDVESISVLHLNQIDTIVNYDRNGDVFFTGMSTYSVPLPVLMANPLNSKIRVIFWRQPIANFWLTQA